MASLEQTLIGDLNDDGLIVHLDFEKVSNSIVTDISPYGLSNDGILKNGIKVSNTDTLFASVANFDGNDDYIQINDSVDINLGNHAKRTVDLWFKVDDKNISDRKQVIYEEGGTVKGLNIYIFNGRLYVGGWNSPESGWKGTFLSTDKIQSNTWHHVTLVLDAKVDLKTVQAGVFSAYLDGQKFGEGGGTQLWEHGDDIGVGKVNQYTLFHDNTTSTKGGFKGSIDDLRVYNRALTADEIAILSNTNQSPIAQNDSFQATENNPLTILATTLLANDNDPDGDSLNITNIDSVNTLGKVSFDGTNISYDPNGKFESLGVGKTTTDSFVYTISDGQGGTASAIVTMVINGVNDAPIAVADMGTTNEDQAITFLPSTLLSNDSDVDGDTLTITQLSNAVNGTVNFDSNKNAIFTPYANFNGNSSFVYTISDGQGGTSTATVTILVNAVNDIPIANGDIGTTNTNQSILFSSNKLLSNDSDPDGDILQITSVENALNGSVTLDVQGNSIFTPNTNFSGNASFDYVVSDGHGGTATATVKVTVNLALPDLVTKYSPNNLPTLPTGSDVFSPSFVKDSRVSPSSELTPQIAEWTRTGERGETLVLTGWQFSNLTGTGLGNDTKFWMYGQTNENDGVLVEATLQKLDGDIAAITLPDSLPEGSSFMVWAQNSTGYSTPVMINQTESWWIEETATRGGVASVFGRNLSQDGGTQVSQVYLEDSAGKGYWAQVVEVNPYKVDFKVPDNLANGDYQVYVHNGDGGEYGWSKPLTMTVNNGLNYTGKVFNVKNFGAKGDGVTDDTAAIKAALSVADKTDWATVYFPTGTYLVNDTIIPGSKIRWLGDGKDMTTIKATNNFSKAYLISHIPSIPGLGANQTTLESLSLDANREGGSKITTVTSLRNVSDFQYLNVKIHGEGTIPFDWHNSTGVVMNNSDVIGKASFLGSAKQIFIDHSNFFGTDYTDSLLGGFGVQEISITNSTGQNLDNSDPNNGKWVKGRFFGDNPVWNISQNQYIGNNRTIDLAPPRADFNHDGKIDIDLNSGEQILWESNSAVASFGTVAGSTANTVTFDSSTTTVNNTYHLTIVDGKGIGQSRQVKSFDSTNSTYEIYDGWNVEPDKSSIIVASKIVSKAVVYGNQLDGTVEGSQLSPQTASSGVQTYHGASDLIIDNNTFQELRTGVYLWSGFTAEDAKPLYFTQVTNNTFKDDLTGVSFPRISGEQGTSILGSVVRDNDIDNVNTAFSMSVNPKLTLQTNPSPHANMNIFEGNSLSNVEQTLLIQENQGSIENTIWLQNDVLQSGLILGIDSSSSFV